MHYSFVLFVNFHVLLPDKAKQTLIRASEERQDPKWSNFCDQMKVGTHSKELHTGLQYKGK